MNNRHMKIFVQVYEKLSMTLAAEALYISQPSVSQAIKELEEYYGVRLFERYPKRLYPTPEGDLLYNYCRQILGKIYSTILPSSTAFRLSPYGLLPYFLALFLSPSSSIHPNLYAISSGADIIIP